MIKQCCATCFQGVRVVGGYISCLSIANETILADGELGSPTMRPDDVCDDWMPKEQEPAEDAKARAAPVERLTEEQQDHYDWDMEEQSMGVGDR